MFTKAIIYAALLLQGEPTTYPVRGLVIDARTEEPLAQARVRIQDRPEMVTTGSDGTFVLPSAPSGQQRLLVELPGYVSARLTDRTLPTNNGIPLLVGPSNPSITVRLERAPIVTGRVLNERGEPLPGIDVVAYHTAYGETGHSLTKRDSQVRTDDRGAFRFSSLYPGSYRLVAMSPAADLVSEPVRYPTYYPGTNDLQQAGTLTIKNVNIDIGNLVLRSARGADVQIRIARPTTQSVRTSTSVQIRRRGDIADVRAGFLPRGAVEGKIGELPPGTYDFSINYDFPPVQACGTVTVPGTGEEVLEVGVKSIEVPGRAMESPSSGGPAIPVAQMHVRLAASQSAPDDFCRASVLGSRVARTAPDGAFRIPNAHPGVYQLVVSDLPGGTYIQSIRQGQTERPFGEIEIKEGMEEITVVLGRDPGRLVGAVTNSGGRRVPAAIVAVIPVEETKAHLTTAVTANHDGSFDIPAGPGEYHVYAWRELDGAAYRNASFMSTYTARGVRVSVKPGVSQALELRDLLPERLPEL